MTRDPGENLARRWWAKAGKGLPVGLVRCHCGSIASLQNMRRLSSDMRVDPVCYACFDLFATMGPTNTPPEGGGSKKT